MNIAQPKDVDVPTGEILPEPEARQEGPTHETFSDGSDPPENQNSTDENDNESGDQEEADPPEGPANSYPRRVHSPTHKLV